MGDAIKYCFANLLNFEGRDTRSTFWWWILLVVLVTFGMSMVSGLIFAASSMGAAFSAAAGGADEAQIQAEVMAGMAEGLVTQVWIGAVLSLVGLALILAAFVRRLRDAGLPALIAVIPVLTTIWSIYSGIQISGEISEIMASGDLDAIEAASTSNAGSGLVSYLGYIVVIIGGLLPSKS